MKTTGVIRRIDDLGRIVIPKEIRKTLRIKDGESVEIFLNSDNIVLKKYSPLSSLPDFYKDYVDSIYSEIGNSVIIVDRDKIVAVSGDLKKNYFDKTISLELDEMIQKRVVVSSKAISNISIIDGIVENISYVIAPIISNGDVIGAVIILSFEGEIDSFSMKTGVIAAKFLGKYIEQYEYMCYNLFYKCDEGEFK